LNQKYNDCSKQLLSKNEEVSKLRLRLSELENTMASNSNKRRTSQHVSNRKEESHTNLTVTSKVEPSLTNQENEEDNYKKHIESKYFTFNQKK